MWAEAQAAHTASKVKGGFGAPSGPTYILSALPQLQPWADPLYQRKLSDPRKPATETALMPRALPSDWSAPHQRPELGQANAALQDPTAEGSAQPQQEPMDVSRSMVAASEAGASEMPSE